MNNEAREFNPQWARPDQVRDILASYRRLQVRERRWWLSFLGPRRYVVQGPAGDIAAAARELDALEDRAWGDRQW